MSHHEAPPFAKRIGETKWCQGLARGAPHAIIKDFRTTKPRRSQSELAKPSGAKGLPVGLHM